MLDRRGGFARVSWGGVGMLTFLAHAHMLDATQQDVSLGLAHRRQKTSAHVGSRETILVGGDQVAESHTAVLKKQLRRQNELAGLTPRGAHIAGLSAVHIHRNLGFENVVQCFVKYIHHVRDTIPPASAFVDQTWSQS